MADIATGDDEYPGQSEVIGMVEEACTGDAFRDYVGRGYAESELDVYYLFPIEEMWEGADDREYVCMAVTVDSSPLSGSVEGSGR